MEGFILFGPAKSGNLTVLTTIKDLWACSDHQCPGQGGKGGPIQDGAGTRLCLTNYLTLPLIYLIIAFRKSLQYFTSVNV